jgi:hypothetical protein
MILVFVKKLSVALARLALKSTTEEPFTTAFDCLLEFVTAQGNATQSMLEQMGAQINEIRMNPFLTGQQNLRDAKMLENPELRTERVNQALNAFISASQYTYPSDPLIPLKAAFAAGACYDLRKEGKAALYYYEEVFRGVKKLEKIIAESGGRRDKFEAFLDTISQPIGDIIGDLIDKSGREYKQKQKLLDTLLANEADIKGFSESLLELIVKRKGVSREEYLKPFMPPPNRLPDWLVKPLNFNLYPSSRTLSQPWRQTPTFGALQNPKPTLGGLKGGLRNPSPGGFTNKPSFLVCPKCGQLKTIKTCPACFGFKSLRGVKCQRCAGVGTIWACKCNYPALR